MDYFTVRVASLVSQETLEVDVSISEVKRVVDRIEDILRARGFLDPKERILKRLEPGVGSESEEITARVLDKAPPDIGDQEWDIYLREYPSNRELPTNIMSLWLYSVSTRRLLVIDLPFSTLFRSAIQYLRRSMAMRFSILLEDQLDCKVYLRQMSEAPEAPIRPTILAIIEPSGSKGTDLARRASANTPVPVTVTDRQNLLVPGRRAWRDYVPELVGHEASDDLRVLLSRAANDQLERLSRESLSWDAEAVGFLIGQVYRDLTDELYVDIEDAVQAGNSVGKVLDQRLDAQGLQSMFYEIRQRYPGRQRIGWYHTHMIGSHRPEPVFEPDASGSRSQSFVQQVHISVADSQFHRSFFSAPWQVVLVLELKEGAKVFYQWRNDQLVRCQGYYHYERAPQSGVEK